MNENHKQLLRKARPYIVQNLADVGTVCDHLISFDILTESMMDEIMSKATNAGKVRALLSVLVMRGPEAFDRFMEVLEITKNWVVVDLLKPKEDGKFMSLPRQRRLETLAKSNLKMVRAVSLPDPTTAPLYSGEFGGHEFRSFQQLEHFDDNKTEYGEYNEQDRLQSHQTESKQFLAASAQVSEQDSFSTGVLVSGSEQHVSHFVSEASSQEGDINRDNVNQSGYRNPEPTVGHSSDYRNPEPNVGHSSGYRNPEPNVGPFSDRWTAFPSDITLPVDSLSNAQARSEQGHEVHVPTNDEHSENVRDQGEDEHEGNDWPNTRKHSRPLNDLSIRQPHSRQQTQQVLRDIANNQVYECDTKFQRRLIIINNSVFLPTSGLPPRTTGDIDATSLDLLFKKLSYSTKTYSDCSCQKIWEVLYNESTREDLHRLDTFVLVILSHGEGEKIYGIEGETMDIRDITQLFNENHCPALKGKPKLVFISASRRQQNKSSGASCMESDLENVECDSLSLGILNSLVSITTDDGRTEQSDMFIARATTQCNAVFKGVSFGSQFIQALIHVIKEHSATHELISLMEKMNQLVKQPSGSPLVEYTNILRKKFYFFDLTVKDSLAMTI